MLTVVFCFVYSESEPFQKSQVTPQTNVRLRYLCLFSCVQSICETAEALTFPQWKLSAYYTFVRHSSDFKGKLMCDGYLFMTFISEQAVIQKAIGSHISAHKPVATEGQGGCAQSLFLQHTSDLELI